MYLKNAKGRGRDVEIKCHYSAFVQLYIFLNFLKIFKNCKF